LFRQLLQLGDRRKRAPTLIEPVLDMVVDKLPPGLGDGRLDRVKLLRDLGARP
jgi:hypothetical protein